MAEAEARAHEAKLTEDHNRRMLIERMQGERDKWLAAINATFSHIEGISMGDLSLKEETPYSPSRVKIEDSHKSGSNSRLASNMNSGYDLLKKIKLVDASTLKREVAERVDLLAVRELTG